MDKASQTIYAQNLQKYIEEKQVHDIFNELLRKLTLNQPENPLDFLINAINTRRSNFVIFILGFFENTTEISKAISTQYNLKHISYENVITNELKSGSELGAQIEKSQRTTLHGNNTKHKQHATHIIFNVVDDDLVNILFHKELTKSIDKYTKGYLVEGYPLNLVINSIISYHYNINNKKQAVFLQEKGITPDRFFILTQFEIDELSKRPITDKLL